MNESRLRTFFELIGRSKQFSPKIPELLARNRGNEEAFFAALSKRYGCTVTPYRKVRVAKGTPKNARECLAYYPLNVDLRCLDLSLLFVERWMTICLMLIVK